MNLGGMRQSRTVHLYHAVNLFEIYESNPLFHQADTPSIQVHEPLLYEIERALTL